MNNGNRGSKILIFVRSLKNIFIITGQPGHCHEDASKNGDDEKEIPDILLGSKEEKKHWGFCDKNIHTKVKSFQEKLGKVLGIFSLVNFLVKTKNVL